MLRRMRAPCRIALAVVVLFACAPCAFATAPAPAFARLLRALDGPPPALADTSLPRLAALDSTQRAALEAALAARPVPRRVAALEFLQVGTPYQLGPLGEGAPPDTDALLRFDVTDCTALQLVSAALAHASDAGGERAAMALAGYRDGVVGYASRFHFTSERLARSPYFRDVGARVAGRDVRRWPVTLNARANGGRWIPIEWTRPETLAVVPAPLGAHFAAWADAGRLPEVVGVAFVHRRTLGDGLDVTHESLLWRGRTLVHASSLAGRVVAVPWDAYRRGPGRSADGYVLFEYR